MAWSTALTVKVTVCLVLGRIVVSVIELNEVDDNDDVAMLEILLITIMMLTTIILTMMMLTRRVVRGRGRQGRMLPRLAEIALQCFEQ